MAPLAFTTRSSKRRSAGHDWQFRKHLVKRNKKKDVPVVILDDDDDDKEDENKLLVKNDNAVIILDDDDEDDNKQLITRKWEEMNHEILVSIMDRLPILQLVYTFCYVCKSWMYAMLYSLFPPGDVLDLRRVHSLPLPYGGRNSTDHLANGFWFSLRAHLYPRRERATPYYTKLLLPLRRLPKRLYICVAKRLPWLKSISVGDCQILNLQPAVPLWKGVEEVFCIGAKSTWLVGDISPFWKGVHRLELNYAVVDEKDA